VGIYLATYKLIWWQRGKKGTKYAEITTILTCGCSWALLVPYLAAPWLMPYMVPVLILVGNILGCFPMFMGAIVSSTVGIYLAGVLWHLGLCQAEPLAYAYGLGGLQGYWLLAFTLTFVQVFVCWKRVAGIANFHLILVPLLGGLYFALGVASLVPAAYGLWLSQILASKPCSADADGGGAIATLLFLVPWLVVAAIGVWSKLIWLRRLEKKSQQDEELENGDAREKAKQGRGDLVKAFLPADPEAERSLKNPTKGGAYNERFPLICQAIADGDFSQLTENETLIAQVCREDGEQRDRLIWGGGLL
jgi:hypothetical protein